MAKWLNSHALLPQTRVRLFRSWASTQHRSSSHAEAVYHIEELEEPATRIYNYVLGGFEEEEGKKRKIGKMLAYGQTPLKKKSLLENFFKKRL